MGKKSRRVRDGTQYSGVKTHIVLWKSGTAIKKTLSVDLARGGTFKDMKLTLESVTSVPVARLYLGLASPLGRFISHADLVRLNKATAAIRRNMGDGERKVFGEYTSLILMQRLGAEGLPGALKGIGNWPRFRPYWRRVRRRVCAHCFKRADLSEPRYLVCSGCGKARYCSEVCQRLDWAEHQEKCPAGRIHVPVRRG